MRPTVFLFDIDGTLVSTGGAGRRAIERAFAEHTGSAAVLDFSFAGMTDPAIVRRGLTNAGLAADEAAIAEVLRLYLRALGEEVQAAEKFLIHEGILGALDEARGWDGCAIGLGTGNIKEGARVKLGRAGLYERFAFGGFGCDSEDRAELLRVGAERGAAALGTVREECRVVVIGDTPKDVAAALAIGAVAIGVGTGPYSAQQLLACGARHAFGSLGEEGALGALRGDEG
jgi:phosphoglycolate phosphatase-like HAD superfamily hydrolase